MSFHTPKAIQNVGIFYCYTGQNMIPKKKIFSIALQTLFMANIFCNDIWSV